MNGDQQNYDPDDAPSGGGLAVTDIYFVLFRRKWLIVFGLLLGVLAAGAMWKLRKPLFQSDAKLLVKYVVETTAPASLVGDSQVNKVDDNGASVIGSEIEILTSLDIAHEVARTVGPSRILPRLENTNDVASAAEYILRKLTTLPLQRTKIIWLRLWVTRLTTSPSQ